MAGRVRTSVTTIKDITALAKWINSYCAVRSRLDAIPEDNGRLLRLTPRQFRCTLAWFIARRPGGTIVGALQYRHQRPDVAFAWVSRWKARDLLERIGCDERPVTHEVLDELPAGKVLARLRSVLVATGALPPRDERLIALEKWITTTVQARTDLAERRILHGYAVWHHMRRFRRRLGEEHTPGSKI